MNISYRWLRHLAPSITQSPQEIADRLATYGAPADELVDLRVNLADIRVARVVEARPHPNADRLRLCTVDAGGDPLQVVCGAPNVRAGAWYPLAPVGATIPGITIRKAKIRGEVSEGMLCSARELGLGREHEGILELNGDFTPGESFAAAVGLDDARLVLDITPNRPDLLSHLGIARELAGADVALPGITGGDGIGEALERGGAETGGIRVEVEDAADCPRYLGTVIRGVEIGPSPVWLDARLRSVGLRPINNVVDATNYILHELGQPLHAFDAERIGGGKILVRRARTGETLVTLDGAKRTLNDGMLVIADAERPVALAGIMGGENSEVSETTTDIFLECALFAPAVVRRTRTALTLSTDASYRFERGVDPEGVERALRRATALIVALAGGRAEPRFAAVGKAPAQRDRVRLRTHRAAQVLGIPFAVRDLSALLRPIGFETVESDDDGIVVEVPGWRSYDVAREDDLIEEVARRHGYDNIPDEPRPFRPGTVPDDPLMLLEDELRDILIAAGFFETRSVPFAAESEGDVELMLPLASNESRLRRSVLQTLIHRLEYNFARGLANARLFEIGTAFAAAPSDGELPREAVRLAAIFTGARAPAHWSGAAGDFDAYDVKGLLERLAARLGLTVREGSADGLAGVPGLLDGPRFHLLQGELVVGHAGRVRAQRIDAPAWAKAIFGVEVELHAGMAERAPFALTPIPAHPGIEHDLALLLPRTLTAGTITQAIRDSAGSLLDDVTIFDVYEGKGIPDGTRSVAYRLRFRAPDRTLTDAEVDPAVARILRRLEEDHGVVRR